MHKRVIFGSKTLPALLVLPQLIITAVFFFWPAGQALILSVMREDAFGFTRTFVGLDNFRQLLSDPAYFNSLKVTAEFSLSVAVVGLTLPLLMAVMADRVIRGQGFYRTMLIWPYAVAPAVAGVLWGFLFNPAIGILTPVLRSLGIDWNFVVNGQQAMALAVGAACWNQFAYNFVFFLAGLQSVPRSLIEAAAIDGAGPARRFWTIIFPLLSPTAFFLLVVNICYAFFDTFGLIDTLTQGGPAQATNILVYKVWSDSFRALDLGSSATESVILMAIVGVLTVVQFRYVERRVHY